MMRLSGFLIGLFLIVSTANAALHDMVEMSVTGFPGTSSFALNAAISPYTTFALTHTSGEVVSYAAQDTVGNWERGRGVWTSGAGGGTLTRGTTACTPTTTTVPCIAASSNANAQINFSATSPTVWETILAEDEVTTTYPSAILAPINAPTCLVTNAAAVLVNAVICASDATKGVGLNAITLTQNSIFAFPTGLPTSGNFQFGFYIDHGTGPYTAKFAAGYRFPNAVLLSGQPNLSTSGVDYVWCASVSGGTLVDCNASMLAMTTVTTKFWTQGNSGLGNSSSATTSVQLATVSAGQSIVCLTIGGNSTTAPTSVSDGTHNLTSSASGTDGSTRNVHLWYELNLGSSLTTPTITATWATSQDFNQILCDVFAGITSVDDTPITNGALLSASQTATSTNTTPSSATLTSPDIIYGATVSGAVTPVPSVGAGFTIATTASGSAVFTDMVSEFQSVTATTGIAATFTVNSTGQYGTGAIALH